MDEYRWAGGKENSCLSKHPFSNGSPDPRVLCVRTQGGGAGRFPTPIHPGALSFGSRTIVQPSPCFTSVYISAALLTLSVSDFFSLFSPTKHKLA